MPGPVAYAERLIVIEEPTFSFILVLLSNFDELTTGCWYDVLAGSSIAMGKWGFR